ncbi:DUF6702 family protein [Rheinheimera baltica]|uniref:Orphan protein n=1 Tax=Rheinheimera baltica TaxID=67576 RepID=A0ABT9HXI7_9GAMM|nr:DUF6702 family protein [Rheinheimera baltica]MDP5135851.1 hypothetical protein [Rheinheimera baltica]MDP5143748.1 hypothetical protein [Rheinheimera baltica]MDP5151870.1 hypothetical protein [Rheinheimera baltica]MDP5190039.1 hypothetical protein [Rheinheimera baltica]
MRLLVGLLLLAGCCGQLAAHEMKTALTKVLFNSRSGNIEVMHRFYVHDAEHGVKQLFDKSADLLNNEQTQQLFSHYVSEHFALTTLSGEAISLTLIGGQLDGRFFWVYQEVPVPSELSGLRVKHSSLQALWPSQVNTVNIEGRGEVKSISFDNKTGWQQLSF